MKSEMHLQEDGQMIFVGAFSEEIKALAKELEGDEIRRIEGKGLYVTRRQNLEEIEGVRVLSMGQIAPEGEREVFLYHARPSRSKPRGDDPEN